MSRPNVEQCPYNEGCACTRYERLRCESCGWNPKVTECRNKEIRRKFKEAKDEGV